MLIVSIYDKKAKSYVLGLGLARNSAIAVRDFSQACTNPESNFNKFPEDYELHCIGEFNEESGKIKQDKDIIILTKAELFVESKKKED